MSKQEVPHNRLIKDALKRLPNSTREIENLIAAIVRAHKLNTPLERLLTFLYLAIHKNPQTHIDTDNLYSHQNVARALKINVETLRRQVYQLIELGVLVRFNCGGLSAEQVRHAQAEYQRTGYNASYQSDRSQYGNVYAIPKFCVSLFSLQTPSDVLRDAIEKGLALLGLPSLPSKANISAKLNKNDLLTTYYTDQKQKKNAPLNPPSGQKLSAIWKALLRVARREGIDERFFDVFFWNNVVDVDLLSEKRNPIGWLIKRMRSHAFNPTPKQKFYYDTVLQA